MKKSTEKKFVNKEETATKEMGKYYHEKQQRTNN